MRPCPTLAACLSGQKRGREAWEDCEDVQELKHHLGRQQQQLQKLGKENADLKRTLKVAEGQAPEETPEELEARAKKIRKSITSNIGSQMVYRKQANTSRLSKVKTILGPDLVKAAKNGPKMLEVTATDADLRVLFGSGAFSKTLRFGASLDLVKGLKFSFEKPAMHLKVSGSYSMLK
ncbi:hypothetical protein WJX74_002186 [Apatococcus lobatus]|uniref:Uncharacterized protein n=1 Tax=Apatococcus lobatus TaxID=904363 RepID=A0AAW1RW92_9CHLO